MKDTPQERDGSWYVQTCDGESGPLSCREAAEAASEGDVLKANLIHNRQINHKGGKK